MKTALLLIDIQNDYFEGGKMVLDGTLEACKKARMVLEQFRIRELPVVYIRHIATRPEATFFVEGTLGADIHPLLEPLPDELVVVKHYPNSFRQTELLQALQDMKIADLVICGMMTHMCVDATVRAAKDFGFGCTLISDACATRALTLKGRQVEAECVQVAFLASLNYFYANVLTTQEYL